MKKREVVVFYLMAAALMSANATTYTSRGALPDMSVPISAFVNEARENAQELLPSGPHFWAAIRPSLQPAGAKPSHAIISDVLVLTQTK